MEDNFQIKSSTVAFDDGVVAAKPAAPVVEATPVVEVPAEESIVDKVVHAVESAFTIGDAEEITK